MSHIKHKSERLNYLDFALVGLNRSQIKELIKKSSYAWIFGEPAKPEAPNTRRALSDACGKYKCHPPEYNFTPFGPRGREQFMCTASAKIPERPGVFTMIQTTEHVGVSKKAAAELAATDALIRLNKHFNNQ